MWGNLKKQSLSRKVPIRLTIETGGMLERRKTKTKTETKTRMTEENKTKRVKEYEIKLNYGGDG